jgi:hypothetical protein
MQFIGNSFTIEAYNPTILNSAGRNSDFEYVTVNISTQIANSTSNYIQAFFLSSFHLNSIGGKIELWVKEPLGLSVGSSTQKIEINSHTSWQNIYSRICFTYILINLFNFNYQLSHNTGRLSNPINPTITNNLNVPDDFYPYLTKKCIFGLNWIWMVDLNVPTQLTI